MTSNLNWHKAAELNELPNRRVKTVTLKTTSIALTHFDGEYAAMDNRCPHQGGPLGEGSIEEGVDGKCWLRCPWHGWDFDPLTGQPPGGHEDTGQKLFPVEVKDDGIYVGIEPQQDHQPTVTDVMAETMVNWGIKRVFGMVGLFLKNRMVVLIAAAGVGIGSILSWVLQPEVSKTLTSGATPKDVGMIGMICGIIAAACIYGAFATRKA